jgi:hypothetical protein
MFFQVGDSRKDLVLGFANIQSVIAAPAGPAEIAKGIVIRITDSKKIQSFGVTNEVGILVMPLPPGRYCFDAFSQNGKPLQLVQQPSDRCFSMKKASTTEVGVELTVQKIE